MIPALANVHFTISAFTSRDPPFRSRSLLNVKAVKMLGDVEAHGNPKESQIYCRGYWNLGSSAGCGAWAGASGEGSSASGCLAGRALRQWASTVVVPGHGNPHSAVAASTVRFRFSQGRARCPLSGQVGVNGMKSRLYTGSAVSTHNGAVENSLCRWVC